MRRPLLISDCDEVLLHMVVHFSRWLDEAHDLEMTPDGGEMALSTRRRADGSTLAREELWPYFDGFFASEMHRQTLVPGVTEALTRIGEVADIVVLTNLGEQCHAGRVEQLERHGIRHRVVCNQGGKGRPVTRLVEEHDPSVTVFVDDLAVHHHSVAKHAPEVWRVHMVSEPSIAAKIAPAVYAHERIDDWAQATDWIMARFAAGAPAPIDEKVPVPETQP